MDSGKAVALTLLDLSTAFDTIDHSILHEWLKEYFILDGTVLTWIDSYLNNNKQKIKLGDRFMEPFYLPFGIPEGLILFSSFSLFLPIPLIKSFQVLRSQFPRSTGHSSTYYTCQKLLEDTFFYLSGSFRVNK